MRLKLLALMLVLGSAFGGGEDRPTGSGSDRWAAARSGGTPPAVMERVTPAGCELVDAHGVPLYDSQFAERTGSSPCDQR